MLGDLSLHTRCWIVIGSCYATILGTFVVHAFYVNKTKKKIREIGELLSKCTCSNKPD